MKTLKNLACIALCVPVLAAFSAGYFAVRFLCADERRAGHA